MPATSNQSSQSQTFYPSNRVILLIIGSFLFLVAMYTLGNMLSAGTPNQSFVSRFSFLIPLIVGGICIAFALTSKLQLSASGVDYFQLGLHATTPWQNIEAIGVPYRGPASIKVLRLRQPAKIIWVWHSAGYRDQIVQIPLSGYDIGEKSVLRAAIEQYAPHLVA